MSLYACGIDFFKEINRHTEVYVTDSVDGEPDAVFTRIEHSVFARAVIFEFQKIIAVVE